MLETTLGQEKHKSKGVLAVSTLGELRDQDDSDRSTYAVALQRETWQAPGTTQAEHSHGVIHVVDGDHVETPLDLLARLLTFVVPLGTADSRAAVILQRYGSLSASIVAAEDEGGGPTILSEAERAVLQTVRQVGRTALGERLRATPLFSDLDEVYEYLRYSLAFEHTEVVRLLFLGVDRRLIADELHSRGTVNLTHLYPREIVKRAVQVGCAALIIVHSHPHGDPTPSDSNVSQTIQIGGILAEIGINLLDHIVVARDETFSMHLHGIKWRKA